MSNQVIRDIVIPVISRTLTEGGYPSPYGRFDIRDPRLEGFLEEELRKLFGVIGANGCQHLKEQLDQAMKNDPFAFEQAVKQMLKKYVRLEVKMRLAEAKRETERGPPDRFSKQRKRYPLLGYYP